ncbi:Uncharacterized protein DAT39_001324, partial [Clarias magur]
SCFQADACSLLLALFAIDNSEPDPSPRPRRPRRDKKKMEGGNPENSGTGANKA